MITRSIAALSLILLSTVTAAHAAVPAERLKQAECDAPNYRNSWQDDELAGNVRGHHGVMINAGEARKLGIEDGDTLEVQSVIGVTQGPAIVVQGIRPDTLVMVGQFDYWATPYAKDLKAPSLNTIAPMSLDLTDATGSGADIVRVAIKRAKR